MAASRGSYTALRDSLGSQLWPVPSLGVALAVVLGVGLPQLDKRIEDDLPVSVTTYLFGGGAEAARTVLDAIAGSLITVTALTFSLTVVTLQLASSQFSPRLLRTFTSDRFVHGTLALFLGTFTYALTVLRTVRTSADGQEVFVPQISVTVALALVLASVIGLVLFLAHLAKQIRVETMLHEVRIDASHTLRRVLPERQGADVTADPLPVPPPDAVHLPAAGTGFLTRLNGAELLAAAVEADAVVLVDRHPGSFVVAGTPIGVFWSVSAKPFDPDTRAELIRRAANAISTGFERTAAQDIGYGLRQLTDVATKALSPGINDPTTAVHAIGHSAALLCEMTDRDLGPQVFRDEHDRIRVVLKRPDLSDLLEMAVSQPRRYGAGDPAVLARVFTLLREVAWCARPEQRDPVAEQLRRLRATTAEQDFDVTVVAHLATMAEQVDAALAGRWRPRAETS